MKLLKNLLILVFICFGSLSFAQQITLPPSGDNQLSKVTQYIGLVEVSVEYSSPDVTAPGGRSRKGEIWGELVPYGLNDLVFGLRNPAPWRAGANKNTIFTVSHDVMVEGRPLKAGSYGLHMIVNEDKWTVIFSNNSSAWGSYFYEEKDDALRVEVKPLENEYHEWLTYEFTERKPDYAVCALMWESLKAPFRVEVPNVTEYYFEQISKELQSSAGFSWQGWVSAANFCVRYNTHLEEGLKWADNAIGLLYVGQKNYTTLSTKARVLAALDKTEESEQVMNDALMHFTATAEIVNTYALQLLAQEKKDKALEIFELNAKKFPGESLVNFGLAKGHSAMGDYKKALKYAKVALINSKDDKEKERIETAIEKLKEGEPMD